MTNPRKLKEIIEDGWIIDSWMNIDEVSLHKSGDTTERMLYNPMTGEEFPYKVIGNWVDYVFGGGQV